MKKIIIILLILLISGCTQIANPSATYCIDQGYTYETRQDFDGGEYGVCIFNELSECEAWDYYNNECNIE